MIKRICVHFLVCFMLLQLIPAATADTVVDMDKKGSISVRVAFEGKALEGLKVNCIKVADLVLTENAYYFDPFKPENLADLMGEVINEKIIQKYIDKPVHKIEDGWLLMVFEIFKLVRENKMDIK